MTDPKTGELQVVKDNHLATSFTTLQLSQTDSIDLSGLSECQINELKMRHAGGMIDLARKAQEMQFDVGALDATLTSVNAQAARATRDGYSVTFQHTHESSIGRTEVIIGNTDKAASGKLSHTATGESKYIITVAIIIAITIVLVAIFANGK